MEKEIKLHDIYLIVVARLIEKYPNIQFGIKYIKDLDLIFYIKNITTTSQEIFNSIKEEGDFKIRYEYKNISLQNLILVLRKNNQNDFANMLENYILFNEYSFIEKKEKNVFYELNSQFRRYFQEEFSHYFSNLENRLKYIQLSYYKLVCYFKEFNETCEDMFDPTDPKNAHRLNEQPKEMKMQQEECSVYTTILFINLSSFLKSLNQKFPDIVNNINEQIKIKPYLRYVRKNKKEVTNIFELINHFRDAECHLETGNEIATSIGWSGQTLVMISNIAENPNFRYGDGSIDVKNHIEPLIKIFRQIFLPPKIKMVVGINDKNEHVFFDIPFFLEDIQVKPLHNLHISQKNDEYEIRISVN